VKWKELLSAGLAREMKCQNITDTGDFEKCVIHCTTHKIDVQERMLPTIPKPLPNLRDEINFKGSRNSSWAIVKGLGFQWKKTRYNRMVIKKHDIRYMQVSYLTALKNYREYHPIMNADDTAATPDLRTAVMVVH
jgi:hypothetical protein